MKRMKLRRATTAKDLYRIHKEAIVLERLSHSPRVLNIYGHCGTTILIEPMAHELYSKIISGKGLDSQERLDKLDNVYPNNNLTASEKLQITLSMAESLADLHGFSDGPIIHADVNPEQWLIAPDGTIKLNDFNNAHEMRWNEEKQELCEKSGNYWDIFRSPEENTYDLPQDESVDAYALGSSVYAMVRFSSGISACSPYDLEILQ